MSTAPGERVSAAEESRGSDRTAGASYGAVLGLTITLAGAGCLLVMAAVLLLSHPPTGPLAAQIIRQRQSAKTALYLVVFAVILPMSVLVVPRLADRLAARPTGGAIGLIAGVLAATLAGVLILVRVLPVSHHALLALLIAVAAWSGGAGAVLARASRPRVWSAIISRTHFVSTAWAAAALAGIGVLLCMTDLRALNPIVLGVGAALVLLMSALSGRARMPGPWERTSGMPERPRAARTWRFAGGLFDLIVVLLLLAAVTNVVVFHASRALPNTYFPPGLIQFQQDWILGPVNQLLAGGAVLAGDPPSQYGVGLLYFLAGWFHIAPIGYGTFGLLDGLLTAGVYIGGYLVLRLAGAGRLLAAGSLALAVTVFVYHLVFPVGSLPELGPLRFGLPMGVVVGLLVAFRWPRKAGAGWVLALVVLGAAAVWSIEGLAFTALTYAAMIAVAACLRPAGSRRRWLGKHIILALVAMACAQLTLAAATLIGSGQLPAWSQYLAYVRSLLLGGPEGSITFGFANWSPGLAMAGACLASAIALVLLLLRAPRLARERSVTVLALGGLTAYAIASFGYIDSRSSTYLLPYVALPLLLAGTLWLALFLEVAGRPLVRRAGLSLGLSVAVLMVAAAWPTVGTDFSQSALAHAYPGGGLRAAVRRLWHAPPIDPRAPVVTALLNRFVPGRRVLILFPRTPDLAIEAMMRTGRAGLLFLGDPAEDVFIASVWMPRISQELASLRPGQRILLDRAAQLVLARLRGRSAEYAFHHPVDGGNPEIEWILCRLEQRFRVTSLPGGRDGFVVATLSPRSGER